jgi:hypothetical protein
MSQFRYFILVSIAFLVATSCEKRPLPQAPQRLLSEAEMVDILTDIQLAEATAGQRVGLRIDTRQKQKQLFVEQITQKYAISHQVFWDNYHYYAEDPQKIDTLYAQVIQKLEKMLPLEQERMRKNPPPLIVAPHIDPPLTGKPTAPIKPPFIGKGQLPAAQKK